MAIPNEPACQAQSITQQLQSMTVSTDTPIMRLSTGLLADILYKLSDDANKLFAARFALRRLHDYSWPAFAQFLASAHFDLRSSDSMCVLRATSENEFLVPHVRALRFGAGTFEPEDLYIMYDNSSLFGVCSNAKENFKACMSAEEISKIYNTVVFHAHQSSGTAMWDTWIQTKTAALDGAYDIARTHEQRLQQWREKKGQRFDVTCSVTKQGFAMQSFVES